MNKQRNAHIKRVKNGILGIKEMKKDSDKQLSRLLRAGMKTRLSLIVVAVGSRIGGRTIRKKKKKKTFQREAGISDQTPEC